MGVEMPAPPCRRRLEGLADAGPLTALLVVRTSLQVLELEAEAEQLRSLLQGLLAVESQPRLHPLQPLQHLAWALDDLADLMAERREDAEVPGVEGGGVLFVIEIIVTAEDGEHREQEGKRHPELARAAGGGGGFSPAF